MLFHPGLPITSKERIALRDRYKVSYEHEESLYIAKYKFLKPRASWMLLPFESLNIYQRHMLEKPYTTHAELYYSATSFNIQYPIDSIQFTIANTLEKMPYEDIHDSIWLAYAHNQKLRQLFKKLVNAWKKRRFTIMNDVDLVTQEIPIHPVLIYDWSSKKIHQFEAATILRDSVIRLLHHDNLFLNPHMPRNPYINTNLAYGTCLSIHEQLRNSGKTHWVWESFAASRFNLSTLLLNFEIPLQIECLNRLLKNNVEYDTREIVADFIAGEYEYHSKTPPTDEMLFTILRESWNNSLVQGWISLCKRDWILRIRKNNNQTIHYDSLAYVARNKELRDVYYQIISGRKSAFDT